MDTKPCVPNMALPLAPESAIELSIDGQKVDVMCTPQNLDDLAAAYLFARDTNMAPGRIYDEPLLGGFTVTLTELKSWALAMFKAAELYRRTGGMHCAALALRHGALRPGGPGAELSMAIGNKTLPEGAMYFVVREDVGRHNAIDKVIGRGCLDMADFSSACILTSGRIAADMVYKVAAARIPVIVSRSIPTTAAFDMAQRIGLTMVGRIGEEEPIVYTRGERIRL